MEKYGQLKMFVVDGDLKKIDNCSILVFFISKLVIILGEYENCTYTMWTEFELAQVVNKLRL